MTVPPEELIIHDNPAENRFEATLDGEMLGYAEYHRTQHVITFTHTIVLPRAQGKGVASKLIKTALDAARAAELRVKPVCPFVVRYINEHSDYQDLVI